MTQLEIGPTLERIVPDALDLEDPEDLTTRRLHLERYQFAARHLRPGRVLDIACGVGYGSRLLADAGSEQTTVLGVDVSRHAVDYARRRYRRNGVEFLVCDAMSFHDPEGFDSIVTLETIEHLADPRGFATRLGRLLGPGGVLVASVPITQSTDLNPHHLHDFDEVSFGVLFESFGLSRVATLRQSQSFGFASLLRRRGSRLSQIRSGLMSYYRSHPVALLRRLKTTLRHGSTVRYLTCVWRDVA